MKQVAVILLTAIAGVAAVTAAPPAPVSSGAPSPDRPTRIVSLDYCADQFVLALADRSAIAALSVHSRDDYSYYRDEAADLPQVRASAEDVLALKPDLIVRTYGGGPQALAFFDRVNIPVLQIGYAGTLDDIPMVIREAASALGARQRGEAIISEFERRRTAPSESSGRSVLYLTPGGVTAGPGSMIGETLLVAGFTNFETRPGWHAIDLEALTLAQPDLYLSARFDTALDPWSLSTHPVMQRNAAPERTVEIDGAITSCGGAFILDAADALKDGP